MCRLEVGQVRRRRLSGALRRELGRAPVATVGAADGNVGERWIDVFREYQHDGVNCVVTKLVPGRVGVHELGVRAVEPEGAQPEAKRYGRGDDDARAQVNFASSASRPS